MPFNIVDRDITQVKADIIVNAADSTLLPGGGVSAAIHRAAGPELEKECSSLAPCPAGEIRVTKGYGLDCSRIIHAVGPVWHGGNSGEPGLLRDCYRLSLEAALEEGYSSIAFPLISSGSFGFPRDSALRTAVDTVTSFLLSHEEELQVTLCLHSVRENERRRTPVDEYIRHNLVKVPSSQYSEQPEQYAAGNSAAPRPKKKTASEKKQGPLFSLSLRADDSAVMYEAVCCDEEPAAAGSHIPLDKRLQYRDESFSEMVLRKIDETGLPDPDIYKRANMDRKLFSKIRSSASYKPSKRTAIALGVALRLKREEFDELLLKAGYALSNSDVSDIIVSYYIENGLYDIFELNNTLFDYDQPTL